MRWLLDPSIFNVLIILMFIAASVRWFIAGDGWQATYWMAGAILNIAVLGMGGK